MASGQDRCTVCNADNRDFLEELGQQALDGAISWRAATREGGLPSHQSFKNHMEKHFAAPPSTEDVVMDALGGDIAGMVEELKAQARIAPPEVAPLYAVAIRNLAGLEETKPSQQHLIQALKAIQEVTGMKMEQRLMLEFARHQFGVPAPEAAGVLEEARPELDVIDV